MPFGLFERQANKWPPAVEVLATVEKDGRVTPVSIRKSLDPRKGGLDEQAQEIVKTWSFVPGTLKGKPVRVVLVLSVPFGSDGPTPPSFASTPALKEFAKGLRSVSEPGVIPPLRVMSMTPGYPQTALSMRIQGEVVVAIEIQADGHIGRTMVVKSASKLLDGAALASLRQSYYLPALAGGEAVATSLVAVVTFQFG